MKKLIVVALLILGSLLSIGASAKQCNIMQSQNGKYFVIKWAEKTMDANGQPHARTWTQNVYPSDKNVFDLVLQCYHPQGRR